MVTLGQKKKEAIANTIEHLRAFRFCGPSDDPDEISAVTAGYRSWVIQLKRLAAPLLSTSDQKRLLAIEVEADNIYSAYDASAEIEALLPDIESALEPDLPKVSKGKPIPVPVSAIVGGVMANYIFNHQQLEKLFYDAGARGDAPLGNCVTKCSSWLKRMHEDVLNPTAVLGKIIEEFMEVDNELRAEDQASGRAKIREVLGRFGLSYQPGGYILGATAALPTKTLPEILKARNLGEVDKEFERATANVEADPPAAITAACAILESLFKAYIEDNPEIEMPSDQSVGPLWKVLRKHIGFDPAAIEDDDMKKILTGMASIVDGIGSLRTHIGTAHGRGRRPYRAQSRHARLAIHAAHTLVGFILETWDERKKKGGLS